MLSLSRTSKSRFCFEAEKKVKAAEEAIANLDNLSHNQSGGLAGLTSQTQRDPWGTSRYATESLRSGENEAEKPQEGPSFGLSSLIETFEVSQTSGWSLKLALSTFFKPAPFHDLIKLKVGCKAGSLSLCKNHLFWGRGSLRAFWLSALDVRRWGGNHEIRLREGTVTFDLFSPQETEPETLSISRLSP